MGSDLFFSNPISDGKINLTPFPIIKMFKVTLLTSDKELYVGLALKVILPTREGQLTILDFHQPILSRLSPGVISIDDRWLFKIKDGVVKTSTFELLGVVDI